MLVAWPRVAGALVLGVGEAPDCAHPLGHSTGLVQVLGHAEEDVSGNGGVETADKAVKEVSIMHALWDPGYTAFKRCCATCYIVGIPLAAVS